MDLVGVVVHGIPAAWNALWRLLLTPSLTMSPVGLIGVVFVARALTDWLGENGWRIPWALVTAWEWVVCHSRGHRSVEQGWCGRCGKYTRRHA